MEVLCSLLVTSVIWGEAAAVFHMGDLVIYSSLARKLYLKCCQQQYPTEFLLTLSYSLNSKEILDAKPLLGISCVSSEEGYGSRSISSMTTNSWIFFWLSWTWSFIEREHLSWWSQCNYAWIGVSDLCGKLILEGFCCIYQPCEKFVPCFAVLSQSCKLTGSSP